jgi:hypothetical protein
MKLKHTFVALSAAVGIVLFSVSPGFSDDVTVNTLAGRSGCEGAPDAKLTDARPIVPSAVEDATSHNLKPNPTQFANNAKGHTHRTPQRETVILENWEEQVSGFECPDQLSEDALAGEDTQTR